MSEQTTTTANVVEVTDQTFQRLVIEESHRRPVVVDFWAAWCAPCRMIGPVLERLAGEYGGKFLLAKLDVDANPQVAAAARVQSIPAVKAFRDGAIVEEFVGAIPETSIREFLNAVVPSEADELVARGLAAETAGDPAGAERLFRQALGADPGHVGATLGLAQVAATQGDLEQARRLLEPLRPDPDAERLLAAIEVSGWSGSVSGDGPLADAERAAAEGRFAEALEGFLGAVRAGGEEREPARAAMLKLFAVLGDAHPLVREYRTKLASALF